MATATTERPERAQFDRGTTDTEGLQKRISVRTVLILVLGVVALLAIASVLATVRITYRPRRGC